MQGLRKLRNLIVIVFVFLFVNVLTLTDFSSDDEKPMIVVKEYYYYSFGDIEIRDPSDLSQEELEKFEFEKVDIKSLKLYRFIGKNETDYEIYIGDVFVNKGKKTADLELITVKEYENLDEITFAEIEKILYNEEVIELKVRAFKKFVGEGIQNNQGGTSNYYKLPLIYCMVENCNIRTGESKRLLTWNDSFKNEKNITEGPYSVQNENGQIIIWKNFENYDIGGGEKIDDFLYIINAYKREEYGGGFNIDKTFMRGTIDVLVINYGKDSTRNLEILSERSLSFDLSTSFIKEDKIAKWTIFPYLFTRYKGYHFLDDLDSNYFWYPFDYYLKQTKMDFVYMFDQEELERNSKDLRQTINSQILYIFDSTKEKNENYKNISEAYHLAMKNFDNIYLVIAAIYGIIIGIILKFEKKIKEFWGKIPDLEKKAIKFVFIIFITYLIFYDLVVIKRINQDQIIFPFHLITEAEKNWVLLFSLVAAGLWALWSFRDQIGIKILKRKKRKVITLCGSTKFKKEYEEWNKKLTLEGNVVLSCGVFAHADGIELTDEQKRMLDEIHIRKIDMSDEIFVLNVDGLIGESTQREINYARKKGKKVGYLEEPKDKDDK